MAIELQYDAVVLYHKNCLDGLGAAWAAWTGLGKQVDLVPVQYGMNFEEMFGDEFCNLFGKDVYCLDFSFSREIVKHLHSVCNFTLLDHHDTAARGLKGLYEEDFDKISTATRTPTIGDMPPVIVVDQRYSGAMLAWRWFHPNNQLYPPFGIEAVQDRDLWAWKVNGSREWTTTAFSYEMTVENFDLLINRHPELVMGEAAGLVRAQAKNVKLLAKGARRFQLDEFDVPIVNANALFASDLGAVLAEGEPFSLTYHDVGNERQFSLRGGSKDIKINEIAERFGGGGHPGAAGFRISFEDDQFHHSHVMLSSTGFIKSDDEWVERPLYKKDK